MTARVLRRLRAAQDAEEIANYLAKDSLAAAVRFLENTEVTLADLASSPGIGSPFAVDYPQLANLRFGRVKGFPKHMIFYLDHGNAIEVVRILHGARDLDAELRKS
jgi:toxin ParE1/3/4